MARPQGGTDSSRKEQLERKAGRRITVQVLFIINAVLLVVLLTPLGDMASYITEALFGQNWLFMFKGMAIVGAIGINAVGWWAAKMGD